MIKNISKVLFTCAICFSILSIISCGISTEEVNKVKGYESAFEFDDEIPVVKVNDIPVIEICPSPYEFWEPEESVSEMKKDKSGDSYDNLLQPVFSEDENGGILIVKTNVPGVKISLNSRYVGESDIGIVGVIPRIYILGLNKDGYKEENLWISVGENKKQIFHIDMEKAD